VDPDLVEEANVVAGVVHGTVEQGLDVALNRGQWCLELVRHVGNEVGAYALQPAQVADVVEHEDHAVVLVGGKRRRARVQNDLPRLLVREGDFAVGGTALLGGDDDLPHTRNRGEYLLAEDDLPGLVGQADQLPCDGVRGDEPALVVNRQYAFLHAADDGAHLRLLVRQRRHALEQPVGEPVQVVAEDSDLGGPRGAHADRVVASLQRFRNPCHVGDRYGNSPRHQDPDRQRDENAEQRAANDLGAEPGDPGIDFRQRQRDANDAHGSIVPGESDGDVQQVAAHGLAEALGGTRALAQRLGNLRACTVIVHLRRLLIGVGHHQPVGANQRDPRAGVAPDVADRLLGVVALEEGTISERNQGSGFVAQPQLDLILEVVADLADHESADHRARQQNDDRQREV